MLKFQIDGLIDAVDKLGAGTVDVIEKHVLLSDLSFELFDQILIQSFLGLLHLREKIVDFSFSCVGYLVGSVGVFNDLLRYLIVLRDKLGTHCFELCCLLIKFSLNLPQSIRSLFHLITEMNPTLNI